MEFSLETHACVASTNDLIKQAIESDAPEGVAVRAIRQAGGYGRQGRHWESPEGGLYLSVLLRPEVSLRQLPTLSLVVGLAVRAALASLVTSDQAKRIAVKWPNDVVVLPEEAVGERDASVKGSASGTVAAGVTASKEAATETVSNGATATTFSKICGISLESHAGGVCVGIGINVLPPSPADGQNNHEFSTQGKNKPAYLADLGFGFICDRQACVEEVAAAVLEQLDTYYTRWCAEGFEAFTSEYASHAALRGTDVVVSHMTGESTVEGKVAGVDADGRLLVECKSPDGSSTVVPVSSGEAHLV